jgi:hypothetical protein
VINKLLLWDDFAGALRQINKNVERPAAEGELRALAPKHPFSARKLERAKPRASINAIARHGCQRPQSTLPRAVERLKAFRWLRDRNSADIADHPSPIDDAKRTQGRLELYWIPRFRRMPAAASSAPANDFGKSLRGFCTQFATDAHRVLFSFCSYWPNRAFYLVLRRGMLDEGTELPYRSRPRQRLPP